MTYQKFEFARGCMKCGTTGANARFVRRNPQANISMGVDLAPGTPEWIERTCTRCGYLWPELPLDAPAPQE